MKEKNYMISKPFEDASLREIDEEESRSYWSEGIRHMMGAQGFVGRTGLRNKSLATENG